MKAIFVFAGATILASQTFGQVTVPSAPVTAPAAPVTAPGAIPNPASTPGSLINPAAPTAVPPQSAGRTFQTPIMTGPPAPTIVQPNVPIASAPGFPSATNFGPRIPFTPFATNFTGTIEEPVGLGFPPPFANGFPPIVNPAAEPPIVFDFPPGSVIRPAQPETLNPANTVGTPLTPGFDRPFPNRPGAVGGPPGSQQGATTGSRPPSVVRPQR